MMACFAHYYCVSDENIGLLIDEKIIEIPFEKIIRANLVDKK
jgi:hypothetical protein